MIPMFPTAPASQGRSGAEGAQMGGVSPNLLALREANDAFRRRPVGFGTREGRWVFTAAAAQAAPVDQVIAAVQGCARMISNAGDPDCENLNGLAYVGDVPFYWNIECYTDHLCTATAGDPLKGCFRVLSVMHGDEMHALMGGAERERRDPAQGLSAPEKKPRSP